MLSNILLQFKYPDSEVHNLFIFFEQLFNPIVGLKKNDKIGMTNYTFTENNNFQSFIGISKIKWKMYKDESSITQAAARWWYNQNRSEIIENLSTIISVYENYLRYIKTQALINNFNDLNNKINLLNKLIIKGFNNLKLSYNDDEYIVKRIELILSKISD